MESENKKWDGGRQSSDINAQNEKAQIAICNGNIDKRKYNKTAKGK